MSACLKKLKSYVSVLSPFIRNIFRKQFFDRLRAANLKLKLSKCNFVKSELLYMGHIISGQGVSVNPGKVEL
jgi:hypothetical protein